jgi:hypothetical protein
MKRGLAQIGRRARMLANLKPSRNCVRLVPRAYASEPARGIKDSRSDARPLTQREIWFQECCYAPR